MNILVLKDNKPGHYNQTEGLILYLTEIYTNLEIEYINVEINSKFSRKILRFLLNNFSGFFENKINLKFIKFFYKNFRLPNSKPDLILSTGGNVSNINAWFAKAYSSKNILNGSLRGLKEELFTYVTTVIDLGYRNQIILDVAPNTITKEKLLEKSENFLKINNLEINQKYYTLLIGGDGAGYKYNNKFYDNLIEFIKRISDEESIKWLITTSRRTPLHIENELEEKLKEYYSYFVSYNKKEEKVLLAFLGLSDTIFVTEESSSMISEAISSEKNVYTIGTNEAKPDKGYLKILNKFETKNLITRICSFDYSLSDNYNSSLKEINFNLKSALSKIFR
ncbi:mitochondrial fission ELM1 family protein [Poseidonibacter lekithochrous]|uniref:ELM1/GtrOC1 family putative glycosyltransferase n=1 Tax=Poseidonibacter TaxID=2321187 RepID=UPI001C0A46DB|nr:MULTISPECIES: ELM1/GtrOC1 family putative glycosyltransferase [Poseidonibacter]MBU3015973.1 mitochondrial fission ELM1 family protein [Poseidonibacter lekithochrous]MDO6829272.1 ELM1/GtrOC1 family putative glycosyltransferase [Poseidonibacter sp. 1_MG-2023]